MIDLDHFKSVNDRLGHAGGDAVLRSFAASAEGVMRQGDIFGRIGGEEFAALLPQTTLDGAEVLAERLRQRIVQTPAVVGETTLQFTVSIGVSAWLPGDADAADIDRLMVAADRALYAAKAQGRDRVRRSDRLA
jgi:diguanylate cyclase (GGDEF)-like protein